MSKVDYTFAFQDKAIAVGQGLAIEVRNSTSVVVDIFGTSVATRTINFYKLNTNSPADLIPINGLNITTNDYTTSTTGIGSETWQFDIVGFNKIVMSITTLTGTNANTSIIGTVIENE